MGEPVTEDGFLAEVRGFRESAFRLEVRNAYVMPYEREDFERFKAGRPQPPPEIDWWRPWLDRVHRFAGEGRHVSRVRILDDPLTDYQRWLLWADPWHAEAGEDIRYMSRARAERCGVHLEHDWWLLDDRRVIVMHFSDNGEKTGNLLVTEPQAVAYYRGQRDAAIRNSDTAAQVVAA